MGFPSGTRGRESACQCRRCKRLGFSPWVGNILWRKAWQPTPVFLPGESPWTEELGELQSMQLQSIGHFWATITFHFFFFNSQKLYWYLSFMSNLMKVFARTHITLRKYFSRIISVWINILSSHSNSLKWDTDSHAILCLQSYSTSRTLCTWT